MTTFEIVFIQQNDLGRLYAIQKTVQHHDEINRSIVYIASVRGEAGRIECKNKMPDYIEAQKHN